EIPGAEIAHSEIAGIRPRAAGDRRGAVRARIFTNDSIPSGKVAASYQETPRTVFAHPEKVGRAELTAVEFGRATFNDRGSIAGCGHSPGPVVRLIPRRRSAIFPLDDSSSKFKRREEDENPSKRQQMPGEGEAG